MSDGGGERRASGGSIVSGASNASIEEEKAAGRDRRRRETEGRPSDVALDYGCDRNARRIRRHMEDGDVIDAVLNGDPLP